MALPLGKLSLSQIERRADPCRRIVELTTLLEWVLRAGRLVEGGPVALQNFVAQWEGGPNKHALADAIRVRQASVHPVKGQRIPSLQETDSACMTLIEAIKAAIEEALRRYPVVLQVRQDPYADLDPNPQDCDERRKVVRAVWRLQLIQGVRAPFGEPADELAWTRAHAPRLSVDRLEYLQSRAITLLDFDSKWRTGTGVLPLPAIHLEPNLTGRIVKLTAIVEHMLSWLPSDAIDEKTFSSRMEQGSGTLLLDLIDAHQRFLPDPIGLKDAVWVQNALIRTIPESRPLRMTEVYAAESSLAAAAYFLRRMCHFDHACALSTWPSVLSPWPVPKEVWPVGDQLVCLSERALWLMEKGEAHPERPWMEPADTESWPSLGTRLQSGNLPAEERELQSWVEAAEVAEAVKRGESASPENIRRSCEVLRAAMSKFETYARDKREPVQSQTVWAATVASSPAKPSSPPVPQTAAQPTPSEAALSAPPAATPTAEPDQEPGGFLGKIRKFLGGK